jgi:hypothetical protein
LEKAAVGGVTVGDSALADVLVGQNFYPITPLVRTCGEL